MRDALGYPLEAISGEEEARIMARGVQGGVGSVRDGLVLDIGGGSTEVVRLRSSAIVWHRSLPEGVVHLVEAHDVGDPPIPGKVMILRGLCRGLFEGLPDDGGRLLVATAGTPTTLAAIDLGIDDYDPDLINGHVLTAARLDELCHSLIEIPAARRLSVKGMEEGREDLIVPGCLLLLEVMARWSFESVTVSDWGLLEGLALEAAEGLRGYGLTRKP